MSVSEMEGKHQHAWRLGSRGTKGCVRNTRRRQTAVTVWLVRRHDVWEFCSIAVEFVHLLRYCTSSLSDLVPIIAGQCYCPICRDILHLKMGPPCCPQTLGINRLAMWCSIPEEWRTQDFMSLLYEVIVYVSCFPVHSGNLIHHISFFYLIALRVWEDHWLWSLLLFGFFLSLLLLLYLYLNVDCSWFGGLLTFVVWDL